MSQNNMPPYSQDPYSPPSTNPMAPGMHLAAGQRPLASRGARFLGALIDGLIQAAILVPIVWMFIMPRVPAEAMATGKMPLSYNLLASAIGIGVFLALNFVLLSTKGKTIGKLVMKTTIVNAQTGNILSISDILSKRYAPIWIVSMIPFGSFLVLVDALMIFRQNHRCLHDDIANTVVVQDLPPGM